MNLELSYKEAQVIYFQLDHRKNDLFRSNRVGEAQLLEPILRRLESTMAQSTVKTPL